VFGPGLSVDAVSETKGRTVVRFVQRHGDVPVRGASASVMLDERLRVVRFVNESRRLQRVEPATIDAEAARALAVKALPGAALPARPVVLPAGDIGVAGFEVTVARVPMLEHKVVLIDAHAGRVIGVEDRVVR
jgi:Zn-dependent metalloprotease